MDNPSLFFLLLFLCPILGYCLIIGALRLPKVLKKRHARRLMESIQPSDIDDLSSGPAEINGRIQSLTQTVLSPLSQTPCVFYQLEIEEVQTINDASEPENKFATCFEYCEPTTFSVTDDTGTIDVATAQATIHMTPDGQMTGTISNTPDHLRNLLNTKYAKGFHRTFFGFKLGANHRSLRFTEYLFQEGDPVCIIGQAIPQTSGKKAIVDGCLPLIITEYEPNIELKRNGLKSNSVSGMIFGFVVIAVSFTASLIALIKLI